MSADPMAVWVRISDPEHPHFGESGRFTGKVISLSGKPMAEVALDHCKHGTDGCFVSQGQIVEDKLLTVANQHSAAKRRRRAGGEGER